MEDWIVTIRDKNNEPLKCFNIDEFLWVYMVHQTMKHFWYFCCSMKRLFLNSDPMTMSGIRETFSLITRFSQKKHTLRKQLKSFQQFHIFIVYQFQQQKG